MAIDATGTPTTLGIPKYNTAADAPSGLGFNAAMDSIDTLLAARLKLTGSPSTSQVPVYDGANWAGALIANANVSATAAIVASKLSGYPTDSSKFLAGDGTWSVPSGSNIIRVTATKTVNTTVAETDLFNNLAALNLAGNTINGTNNKAIRIWASGDWMNNSGGALLPPRFKLKYGATVLFDTNAANGTNTASGATRYGWVVYMEVLALTDTTQAVSAFGVVTKTSQWATGEGAYDNTMPYLITGYSAGTATTTSGGQLAFTVINPSANAAYETKFIGGLVYIS